MSVCVLARVHMPGKVSEAMGMLCVRVCVHMCVFACILLCKYLYTHKRAAAEICLSPCRWEHIPG